MVPVLRSRLFLAGSVSRPQSEPTWPRTTMCSGAAFVVKAACMQGYPARTLAEWETRAVDEQSLYGPLAEVARSPRAVYLPHGPWETRLPPRAGHPRLGRRRTPSGSNSPATSRRCGHPVLTVGPTGFLTRYTHLARGRPTRSKMRPSWLVTAARRSPPDGRIGMMGISFAGGLSIVAAGRPALANRVVAVLSLGGHGDLPRTLRYLCTGIQADGTRSAAARLRRGDHPARCRRPGRAGRPGGGRCVRRCVTFLEASRLDLVDKAQVSRGVRTRARARGQRCPSRRGR